MTRSHLRIFLWILAGLIISIATGGCASRPQPVAFNHTSYQFKERQGEANIFTSTAGSTLRVEPSGEGTRVTVDGQVYLVEGTASDVKLTLPDGRTLEGSYSADGMAGSISFNTSVSPEEWDYLDDLRAIVFSGAINPSRQGGVLQILAGLALAGAGLLAVLNPSLAWQLSEGWRFKNVEPSELYLVLARVGGVVLIIIALVVIFSVGKIEARYLAFAA